MIRFQQTRKLLGEFQFQNVFRELGWDNPPRIPAPEFQVDGARFRFTPIAEQGGLHVFEVSNLADGTIPPRATQLALKRLLTPLFAEHFLIFVNSARTSSLWLWMWRDGNTRKPVDHRFDRIQSGELLLQKLSGLYFDFDDLDAEGKAIIGPVLDRLNAAFFAEKVTKRFYEDFRKYKDKFITFIQGIESLDNRQWYASVILNRLMFIYFLQQKRFLSGDAQYLQNKFKHCEETGLNYYRDFLCPLFFKGFALGAEERDAVTNELLGTVPYLNGGLFLEHPRLEADGRLQRIRVENAAFERLLAFFGYYNWHLDERPMRNDREINPDVLGYIFEKYVNQKEMGAYYTKEDITEYISKSTIIPFIFEAAARKLPVAFNGDNAVWKLLQLDPDRYIYDAVKKGAEQLLPADIESGVNDVTKRAGWNKPARAEFALPTEIWREVVARRQRCGELRAKMASGEVRDINTLVTLNLNLLRFLEDVINDCRDPELLTAIYYTVAGRVPDPEKQSHQEIRPGLSVLDLTCGSGAFLFAALNILEPIYESCLSKMREMLAAADGGARLSHFQRILGEVDAPCHPNQRYYILKSIVVNNLYGVDIMEEAVEICKLRLFLKLVAQVDADPGKPNQGIEPLPDIDFNIRAGNTLVGYATKAEVEKSAESDMLRKKALPQILEDADIVDRAFKRFRQLQTLPAISAREMAQAKRELQHRLEALEEQLNCFLAEDYQLGLSKRKVPFEAWLTNHQPFHWFIEFYGILQGGGFDIIIGNPPYVEYKDVKGDYQIRNYKTESCSNLFVYVLERCTQLSHVESDIGMIVPLSAFSTDRMIPLITHLKSTSKKLHVAHFSWRPGKLFDGVNLQLSILLQKVGQQSQEVDTTRYLMWDSEARPELFSKIEYVRTQDNRLPGSIPKLGAAEAASILEKLRSHRKELGACFTRNSSNKVYYRRGGLYWKVFVDFVTGSSEEKIIHLLPGIDKYTIIAALSSDLWWWYFTITSDCRHLGNRDFETFPFDPREMSSRQQQTLSDLGKAYVKDLKRNAVDAVRVYKGKKSVDCLSFRVNQSKLIIDEIDRELGRYYGLTPHELDFIINYDIKYRLGLTGEAASEGEEE
jgi:hypothetical protein